MSVQDRRNEIESTDADPPAEFLPGIGGEWVEKLTDDGRIIFTPETVPDDEPDSWMLIDPEAVDDPAEWQ